MEILGSAEIARIERQFASGISAPAILEIFRPKGVRLSEATFRKYVQAGLLPRSRRVGQKGKHRGSQGLYPVESVRRISAIKKMMAAGLTLEDIKHSFVFFKNQLDPVERGLRDMFQHLEEELTERRLAPQPRRALKAEIALLRRRSSVLTKDIARVVNTLTAVTDAAAPIPRKRAA